MTEDKEFCKFYQKGRKCKLTQDDFRCIENLGGNCASYRYYTFELEQECNELKQENERLKKEIASQKGLITVGSKQQYEMTMAYNKCKSALEEIREIIEPLKSYDLVEKALNKINEVLQ